MYYYQHHIGDFIKATSRLTDSQVMAYLRLIWLYYDKDGIVTNDPEQICFEIGSDVKTIKMIVKTYFEVEGEFLRHSRCDKELQGYLNKSVGGKKGADKRWKNKVSNSLPIGIPMPTQCDPNANQEPITKNHKPINTPDGVSDAVFNDYLEVRKTKKAKWSDTALKGLIKEAEKAGLSLQEAMELCCARGWVGFKAEWVKDQYPKKQETGTSALAELFMKARGHDVKQIT
jgi:uncharacterized protein YdaU (DUF1376 family)